MKAFPEGSYAYYFMEQLKKLPMDDKKARVRLERESLWANQMNQTEVDSGETETDRPGDRTEY